ncbi:NAD-dependent epimerase/dehydratase family protein [Sessilibacter sp. MAH4]
MTHINNNSPILVTGATGYVAGHLVKKLLAKGHTVHAAVRDPENPEKLKYLNEIAAQTSGNIVYFKADLLKPGSYAQAMKGCELVYHTASPFMLKVNNPKRDLIEPALLGTRNVLEEANYTESVKRVVVTSSCAAIYGDNIDLQTIPNKTLTEEHWNTTASESHNPYAYSKTLAEREAWKIAKAQSRWDLITVNPSLVIGPGINPNATSESFNIIKQLGAGKLKSGAPKWGLGLIDVRDVAEIHLQAGFTPSAHGRYIACAYSTDTYAMTRLLLEKYGTRYPIPKSCLPKWLLWLVGPIVDNTLTREMISKNVDYPWQADNSKATKAFNINYRDLKTSLEEFFQQAIDSKLF